MDKTLRTLSVFVLKYPQVIKECENGTTINISTRIVLRNRGQTLISTKVT